MGRMGEWENGENGRMRRMGEWGEWENEWVDFSIKSLVSKQRWVPKLVLIKTFSRLKHSVLVCTFIECNSTMEMSKQIFKFTPLQILNEE